MFIDIDTFRKKMGLLMQHHNQLTEEEKEVLSRALKVHEEMERILDRYDEKFERKMVKKY